MVSSIHVRRLAGLRMETGVRRARRAALRSLPVALALAVTASLVLQLAPASAQPGPKLTRRQTFPQVSSDQGRLTTFAGVGCAGDLRTGADIAGSLISGGITRTYRLHMPPTVQRGKPAPLVLNFHALGSSGEIQEHYSGLRPLSDAEGFILVSPDGTGSPAGWNALLNEQSSVDDVAFVDDLMDHLQQNYCIDVRRIYATGFSNGGMLAARAGCRLGTRIAAVAPVAGVYAPGDPCVGVAPILAIHGQRDDVVPFSGGTAVGAPYPGARAAVADWAGRIAFCHGGVLATQLQPGVMLESYTGCGLEETSLVVVEAAGHAPPDGSAELIWEFFEKHRLPFSPGY
jgi:polyhydroxybutyrate depolymerase